MGINSIQISQAGLEGVTPRLCYIDTTDTIATIITAGYLNKAVANGYQFKPGDMVCVTSQATPGAALAVGWYEVTYTSPNWSLSSNNGTPGSVTLPTITNHIATYTGTGGTLSEDPATAISGGNIQAGLSGTAGYVASFPSAAAKGSLHVTAVANTGDTLVTISNAAHGQASVYSIPDSGASTANFIVSKLTGTQHITVGNLQVDGGNITAGISGTAGTVSSFPGTSAKGSLVLAAVANTGDTLTTISNAAMGQASVVSIPDPGAATAKFLLDSGAQTMAAGSSITFAKVNGTEAGNAVTASGVAGLITTSSLSTAGAGNYAITWTNTKISSTSSVLLQVAGGTNTTQNFRMTVAPGSGSATLTIYNLTAATSLNGTILISYVVL